MNTEPAQLKETCDEHAPDGSEIYRLANGSKGSMCQCVLPVDAASQAISHKTVEELWFFVEGQGEVYRKGMNNDNPIQVKTGTSLVIPVHTVFQFRNTGQTPLKFIVTTIPSWPGPNEVGREAGIWQ